MVDKFLSHYKITAELGRGGMGIVYRAEDTKLDRTVALKVLPAAALASEEDRARFYREAKAAAQLHHPHIASVFEIDEAVPEGERDEEPRPFIAMEYIEGETLDARIKKGPLKLNDAVRIAREIASALEAAHEKDIVHRDIKSANVMLTVKDSAKVLDFGLAQTAQSTKLTRTGSTLGTVAYMSPEQARGEEVDARTDLWSLGVILYEMIAGRSPFPGDYEQAVVYEILNQQPEPLTAVRTGVPMELERITIKCMAKEARSRYQSATDLIVDLENVDTMTSRLSSASRTTGPASGAASGSTAVTGVEPASPTARKSHWRPIFLTAVATAAVCAFGFLAVPRTKPAMDTQLRKLQLKIPGIEAAAFPEMNAEKSALYFAGQDTAGMNAIYRLDLETEELDLVAPYGIQPTLSPDGKQMAYVSRGEDRSQFNSLVMSLPGGRPRPLPDSIDAFFWVNDHTVGGRTEIGAQLGTTAILYDLETSSKRTVVDITQDPRGGRLYFSGSRFRSDLTLFDQEFVDGSSPILYLLDMNSGSSTVLFEGGMNGYFLGPEHILYQTADGAELLLQAIDVKASAVQGRSSEILPQVDWTRFKSTRDGDLLFFDQPRQDSWLKEHDEAGNETFAHRLPPFSRGWRANRSGTTLVGLERPSASSISASVVLLDVASGIVSSILESRPGVVRVSWSFDERRIRVLEEQDVNTIKSYSIPANGVGRETPIETELFSEYSSNGSRSIFARPTGHADSLRVFAYDKVSGQERTVDVFPIYDDADVGISPDGHYLQVRRSNERWVTTFEGGDRIPIPVELDYWGPSGRYLYGSQDGKIIRAPYSTDGGFHMTGPLEIVVDVDDSDASLISVQPDRILTINDEYVDDYVVLHWWQNYARSLGE